ncbi:MAG: FAD-dependent oxidoreductase [Planctomycetota bacterium]
MKIAVVGTGISGLVVARGLAQEHDITVFEAGSYVGGHTNTIDVQENGRTVAVDTGFIVFNEVTYPGFCELLKQLRVPYKPSNMGFSVACEQSGLEYSGSGLGGLFAQRRNWLRPGMWRLVRDIVRFYREAPAVLERPDPDLTLGQFLEEGRYSRIFIDKHLVPMCAAVWSARADVIHAFPMRFLVQFFHNHGFLRLKDRPVWQVVRGGSRSYVEALIAPFADRIRLSTPVRSVRRVGGMVQVETAGGEIERFDRVVLACHGDQALRLLADADSLEQEILGAFAFQRNLATLHWDEAQMPRCRRAWAAWNYHVRGAAGELPEVTYWMNELQGLDAQRNYFVSLNRSGQIDPAKVLREIVYHHPVFTLEAVAAQARHHEIDGRGGVHYAGAWWRYGFHEDGLQSGLRVVQRIQQEALV